MKELIDFSSLNEAFGLPACESVLVDWSNCDSTATVGFKHAEETRKAISEGLTGRHCSAETRKRISDAKMGHAVSEHTRKKVAEVQSKTFTLVADDGTITTFHNMAAFCREHNMHRSGLHSVVTGKRTSYKGWTKPWYCIILTPKASTHGLSQINR